MELEILKTIIEKTLGKTMGTITEKTTFVDDLGIDSLDFFQILIDLEETYDIQYITGNILYSDENTITVEVGESGNYYNMVFNIENAVLNIANGSAVRSGLNVDLEYYSQNNVNIVIMLTSDGEEYLPSSTLEEAQKMADEYVPDVSESENEDFEDTPPSEY